MNNFSSWNILKQNIEKKKKGKRYHSGDIWWCILGKNIGFEQNGGGNNFERPVLVMKDFNEHVCLIVPLTSKKKINKFHFHIGEFENTNNYAILSQIRLIDTKRLVNKIGSIDNRKLFLIKKAIYNLMR